MRYPTVIGVDPGANATGVVVREGLHLHHHAVITRTGPTPRASLGDTLGDYLEQVATEVDGLLGQYSADVVGLEDLNRPSPHLGITDPGPILATALLAGFLAGAFSDPRIRIAVRWVPPGHNGAGALRAYPAELVTDGERRLGLNRPAGQSVQVRHARSAWDIAGRAAIA